MYASSTRGYFWEPRYPTRGWFLMLTIITSLTFAQDSLQVNEELAVAARPSKDSITLRWAPRTSQVWLTGNQAGYRVERYVIVRNGALVSPPEKAILTQEALKPWPEQQWEKLVPATPYAVIAAQALFGEKFEVDLGKSDVIGVVNKVREIEQRFSFALFAADMSPATARAMALWFTDRTVRSGEKYLYRIVLHEFDNVRGSAYIAPDDPNTLLSPTALQAEFSETHVSLRWESSPLAAYSAFQLERSVDGVNFTGIHQPVVQASPEGIPADRYVYAIDSLPNPTKVFYYRVKGITPFGEQGEPSNVVSGAGKKAASDVPQITSGENLNNTVIRLRWEYPKESELAIKGFHIERAQKMQGDFETITPEILKPGTRQYDDPRPNTVNYYRLNALGLQGEVLVSTVFFAQLVDSIPPLTPTGLKGVVDEAGNVSLEWNANQEPDIYGYRVYRSNFQGEELTQITSEPVRLKSFLDQVAPNSLNEAIYYSVMAVDQSQNGSPLSPLLKIPLPDKVPPQPPVLLPLRSTEKGVMLTWWPSGSTDVVQYDVYRQKQKDEWQRISIIPATTDTLYQFLDTAAHAGGQHAFLLIAVDDAGLESNPTVPVKISRPVAQLVAPLKWNEPLFDREKKQITLRWNNTNAGVRTYQLFRAVGNGTLQRYRVLEGAATDWVDRPLKAGTRYTYQMMATYSDGHVSALSETIMIDY